MGVTEDAYHRRIEAQHCPVCDGALRVERAAAERFLRCAMCGYRLLTCRDVPADYWPSDSNAEDGFWDKARRNYFVSALQLLEAIGSGRRLIDVGGGIGFFAERALERGWDAVSLDISDTATRLAQQRLGRKRAWSEFPDEETGSFDVVSLWCVVAHTPRPREVIELARRALGSSGHVWLTTPNASFQMPYAAARRLIGRPLSFAAHGHIGHFTPGALNALLRLEGFADVHYHFRGSTETCELAANSTASPLIAAKRAWNKVAFAALQFGFPSVLSELQVTARLAR